MSDEPPFSIVEADLGYVPYLAQFGRQAFIDAYLCVLPYEELDAYTREAFDEGLIRDEIGSSKAAYLICRDEAAGPCGYAKALPSLTPEYLPAQGCLELQRLYVDEAYKGRGVGKRLHARVEQFARERGRRALWLRVWEGNAEAIAIYHRWGYEIRGEERYQVANGSGTVHVMFKAL